MGVFSLGKVIAGSLFKKPATLMYPVIPREWEERTRGAVSINIDGCVLCGACARACPTNAIEVDRKAGTWSIERMNCVQCRGCVDNCPPNCLTMDQKYTEPGVEKVIDKFEIPKKEKAAKKDAPAKDAEAKGDAPAADAADGDGPLTCDLSTCIFCGLCAKNCPVDALEVDRKEKSWKVDEDECIKCGACIDKCPKGSLSFGGAAAAADDAAAPKAAPAKSIPVLKAAEDCIFCNGCANECPADAITVEDASWELDEDACLGCGACISACPIDLLEMREAGAEEAPAAKAEEAPAAEAAPAKEEEPAKKAPAKLELDPKVEGYLAEVKAELEKLGLATEDAVKKLEESGLADQLKAFPYLLNKAAKEAAEKIK